MEFFRFMEQSKSTSFTKFIFSRTSIIKTLGYLAVTPYYVLLLQLQKNSMPRLLSNFLIAYIAIEFLLVSGINLIVTQDVSRKLMYWRISGSDTESRTQLYKEVIGLPLKKAVLDYVCFLIFCFFFSVVFDVYFDVNSNLLMMMNLFMGFTGYLIFLVIYKFTDFTCSEIAVQLVSEGIDEREITSRKFFGLRLRYLFVMYIVVPIFLSSIVIFIVSRISFLPVESYVLNGEVSFACLHTLLKEGDVVETYGFIYESTVMLYILVTVAFNIGATFIADFMFISKIINTSNMMSNVEENIMLKNIDDVSLLPTDLASEFSYSIYLINKTVMMFRELISKITEVNNEINTSIRDLSQYSVEISDAVDKHVASMDEVFLKMEDTGVFSSFIGTNIDDMLNVFEKTIEDVHQNTLYLNQNSDTMKEIDEINRNTIYGIEKINEKIKGIRDIANLINGLSSQIKIIAFNADLEAGSMEGENQKFGVVVQDIRDFADKTIDFTTKIMRQIYQIEDSSQNLLEAGHKCTKKIKGGNKNIGMLVNIFGEMDLFLHKAMYEAIEVKGLVLGQKTEFDNITQTVKDVSVAAYNFSQATKDIRLSIEKLQRDSDNLKDMRKASY